MEIDQIKLKVAEQGGSIPILEGKAKELIDLHPMYEANHQLAYIVAANQLGIKVSSYVPQSSQITPEQIQDEDQFMDIAEIAETELRVINMRGYVLNAPQSQENIRQTSTGNAVVYMSVVDKTGEAFMSCYDENPMNYLVDEKMQFLEPVALKQVLIKAGKDGRKFLNITNNTSLTVDAMSFGRAELYRIRVANISDKYSVVRAVLSGIETNTYTGCPECRKGGFDVEAGESVYCPSEACRTTRVLQTLEIINIFLMDESGSIQCGISRFNPINVADYEIGMMVVASINKWTPNTGDEDRYTIMRMRDISNEAYGLELQRAEQQVEEAQVVTPEDFETLERLFAFELENCVAPDDEHDDKVLSIYKDICEFYNEVTPRDLSRLIQMKLVDDPPKALHSAFKKALTLGLIKFDRNRGLISPANN